MRPAASRRRKSVVEQHELVDVWSGRDANGALCCKIEHLGEDCFEVRVLRARQVVSSEFVEGIDNALDRAEELKRALDPPPKRRR